MNHDSGSVTNRIIANTHICINCSAGTLQLVAIGPVSTEKVESSLQGS